MDRTYPSVADIAARIMHTVYRPGHALITLVMTHPTADPATNDWGIKFIHLQPDLTMFYTGIDQPRDVIAALFETLLPGARASDVSPPEPRLI